MGNGGADGEAVVDGVVGGGEEEDKDVGRGVGERVRGKKLWLRLFLSPFFSVLY